MNFLNEIRFRNKTGNVLNKRNLGNFSTLIRYFSLVV